MKSREQRELIQQELSRLLENPEQEEAILRLFERAEDIEEEERRKRQMEGIMKAKEKGKTLGRPRIEVPEEFWLAAEAWERKEISAPEGAAICGMGVSTFYRRISDLENLRAALVRGKKDANEKEV